MLLRSGVRLQQCCASMSCVWSGSTDRAELVSRLDEAAVAYAQVNDCGGLAEHPALRRVTVDSEVRPRADRPPLAGCCIVSGHDREMMARWLATGSTRAWLLTDCCWCRHRWGQSPP